MGRELASKALVAAPMHPRWLPRGRLAKVRRSTQAASKPLGASNEPVERNLARARIEQLEAEAAGKIALHVVGVVEHAHRPPTARADQPRPRAAERARGPRQLNAEALEFPWRAAVDTLTQEGCDAAPRVRNHLENDPFLLRRATPQRRNGTQLPSSGPFRYAPPMSPSQSVAAGESSPFPDSPRVVYTTNPLVEVICQLRFPPILEILSSQPAEFQSRIRSRYPLYSRNEQSLSLPNELANLLPQLPFSRPPENVVHRFNTEDEKLAVSLSRDFLAISTTAYGYWEAFRTEINAAKAALEEVYRPAFYTRLGLRYSDVIDRSTVGLKQTDWSELLKSWMLGVLDSDAKAFVQSVTTQAVIRLPEVRGGHVNLRCKLSEDGQKFLIDADFFTKERSAGDDVLNALDSFNRSAGRLFRWAITDRLRDALGPQKLG